MAPLVTSTVGDNPAMGSYAIKGGDGFTGIWCASARPLAEPSDNQVSRAIRTAHTCYVRGLREQWNYRTNDGASWVHRRIIIAAKGLANELNALPESPPLYFEGATLGMTRILGNQRGRPGENRLFPVLFAGRNQVDYSGALHAKVDTSRITLLYDKRMTIRSGNDSAQYLNKRFWHPINKNIVYNNDENGDKESDDVTTVFSHLGKSGLGDVIVIDIIDCADPSSTHTLTINPQATLYWHER